MAKSGSGEIGCVIVILFLLVAAAWVVAVWTLPNYKMNYSEEVLHRDSINAVALETRYHLKGSDEPIVLARADDGLDIFISRSSVEAVPFPDRDRVFSVVANKWCANISSPFLPSVRFRDVQTGATLARKLCAFSELPSPGGSYTGTVHNRTANLYSAITVQMTALSENSFKGCIQIEKPLYGTGSITGNFTSGKLQFVSIAPGVHIRFNGVRVGDRIGGEYTVTDDPDLPQVGEFTMHQDSEIMPTFAGAYSLENCPPN